MNTLNHNVSNINKGGFLIGAEENLAKAMLERALMDSLGSIGSVNFCSKDQLSVIQSQARDFFNTSKPRFRLMCDIAGTDPDYIVTLHKKLLHHYERGHLKKLSLKLVIVKLINHL